MSFTRNLTNCLLRSAGLTLALGLAASAMADEDYVVSGSAYDVDSNQLIYRELYTGMNGNKEVTVNYVKPDGNTFATKILTYKGEATQPEFELNDKRDGEKTSAQFTAGRLVLSHSLNYATNEKTIMNNATLVIDAGFDAFIQQNWAKLTSGKNMTFDFALPTRMAVVKLEAREIDPKDSPAFSAEDPKGWHYFKIAPANKFKAIFADSIYLAYSGQDKYLMRFYGRSNLDSDKGKPQDVRIEYEYF